MKINHPLSLYVSRFAKCNQIADQITIAPAKKMAEEKMARVNIWEEDISLPISGQFMWIVIIWRNIRIFIEYLVTHFIETKRIRK